MLTTNLYQNGTNNGNAVGYDESDIKNCLEKNKHNICYYCHEPSATIFCYGELCDRVFHLSYGLNNGYLVQFENGFHSYCDQHCPIKDEYPYKSEEEPCDICYELLEKYPPVKVMPVCCANRWFHIECIRKYAFFAGNFFKCVMCDNKTKEFKTMCRMRGVYIPERAASWEKETDLKKGLKRDTNKAGLC